MSRSLKVCAAFALAALVSAHAEKAQAATIYRAVGQCVTKPIVAPSRHYDTIQAAVDASIASLNPAIILVCPGNYPEQVVIADTPDYDPIITIKSAGPDVAVIHAPQQAATANVFSPHFGWVAPQVLVNRSRGVTITNIEIDGRKSSLAPLTTADCPIGLDGNPATLAGIMYANAGDPESSFVEAGTIKAVNIHDLPDFGLCGADTNGVVSDNSFIKIDDNTITNIYSNGITMFGGNAEILRNKISHITGTGVRVAAGHPYDVSRNNIWWVHEGIVLEQEANGVTVDSNTFTPIPTSDFGIRLNNAQNNSIVNNFIDGEDHVNHVWGGVFAGIALNTGSSANVIEGNVITHCVFACIMDANSVPGGNSIDWNDFYESHQFGLWIYNSDADLPNIYSNLDGNHDIPVRTCISPSGNTQCLGLSGDEPYFLP